MFDPLKKLSKIVLGVIFGHSRGKILAGKLALIKYIITFTDGDGSRIIGSYVQLIELNEQLGFTSFTRFIYQCELSTLRQCTVRRYLILVADMKLIFFFVTITHHRIFQNLNNDCPISFQGVQCILLL
jgi:hypothetical protein